VRNVAARELIAFLRERLPGGKAAAPATGTTNGKTKKGAARTRAAGKSAA
jgi:hypothetical protein